MQDGFYDVLLCLADFCPVTGVRHAATQLLDMLPTDRGILGDLRRAIDSPTPAESLTTLLLPAGQDGQPIAKPARLFYTLQVISLGFTVSCMDFLSISTRLPTGYIGRVCD